MISRLYHSFLRKTSNSSIYSLAILMALALIFVRPEAFWNHGLAIELRQGLWIFCCLHVAIDALFLRKIWGCWLAAIFVGLLLAHSWVSIFTPAIHIGISVQDFMLAKDVSAYFQWNYATRLAANVGVMLLLMTALPDIYRSASIGQRRWLWYLVIFILAANVTVALLQGFYDLNFMAVGSGSAISAGRSAALFEDSGASTVLFAAALAFMLGKLLENPSRMMAAAVILIAIAGYKTGGRTFFVSAFFGGFVAFLIFSIRFFARSTSKWSTKQSVVILISVLILALLWTKIPDSTRDVFSRFAKDPRFGDGIMDTLANHLWETDSIRATSLRVMSAAARSHVLDGAGFGTYHSYYRKYLTVVEKSGAPVYGYLDLPSAFYGMIPAELGSINAYAMLLLFSSWLISRRAQIFSSGMLPVTAALASISCSFWFGVHIIFQSFSCVLGVLIAAIEVSARPTNRSRKEFFLTLVLIFGLILAVGHKVRLAPRQVIFRSEVLGAPQMPLAINAPISPRGRNGQWLASGAEIFYPGKPVSIFIEHPENLYPLTVTWTIKGSDGQKLGGGESKIDKLDAITGGVDLKIGDEQSLNCPQAFNTKDYCSLQVSTKPSWKWGRDTLGWFYVKE